MKKLLGTYCAPAGHWIGDGFPVRSLFSYHSHGQLVSPFLLLDYAGPIEALDASRERVRTAEGGPEGRRAGCPE
jgi:quercetin 2,3-dioxygenase